MLSFLQGFAIGLMIMAGPWFIAGLFKPEWVLPDLKPSRFKVFLRYGLIVPFSSIVLGLTSLWGGFGASLLGWVAGLGALFVAVPLERRLRQFFQKRQQHASVESQREQVDVNLEQDAKRAGADSMIKQLNAIRIQLEKLKVSIELPERFYSRYAKLQAVLSKCFQPNELAMQRAQDLISDVYKTSLHQLDRFIDVQQQLQLLDLNYIQRQLTDSTLTGVAREALLQRQTLAASLQQEARTSLAEFEKTLTALDATRLKLSQLNQSTSSNRELEHVLEALERFNQRIAQYEPTHTGMPK